MTKKTVDADGDYPALHHYRETWYSDEVQKFYVSVVDFKGIILHNSAKTSEPNENIRNAFDKSRWLEVPGTNGKYHFSLKTSISMV
jgi:hypothetical protein